MVLLMLYWMGSVDIEKHASNLGASGAVAAGGVGAGYGAQAHGDWQAEGFEGGT